MIVGRPKGFVPEPCKECGNRGRHKTTCSRSNAAIREPERKPLEPTVRPYTRKEEDKDAIVEGGLPKVDAYVSQRQDYTCACGEILEMGRQHWVDSSNHNVHLCMEHAAELVRGKE